MRSYGKIPMTFWQATVKPWRGDAEAITVALYLASSPHANMWGLFHCPIMFICYETGLSEKGASEALRRLSEGAYCTYDHDIEYVWVHEMAAIETAPELKPGDNRIKSAVKHLLQVPNSPLVHAFFQRYAIAFNLDEHPDLAYLRSPLQAPLKALRSQEQGQGQLQGQGQPHLAYEEGRNVVNTHAREQVLASSPSPKPNSYLAAKEGGPIGKGAFAIPRSEDAGRAFLKSRGVPDSHIGRFLPDLMEGNLYPFDIEEYGVPA